MDIKKILKGKKILIVDDEPDVLESLIEILSICKIDTAGSFDEAKKLLEEEIYDIAILDIMGVQGFDLLKIATNRKTPALMLTAHALSEGNLKKSAEDGATYFAPKDKMADIDEIVAEVLEALENKRSTWERWFNRLSGYYDTRFQGTGWREKEKKFWEEKIKGRYY